MIEPHKTPRNPQTTPHHLRGRAIVLSFAVLSYPHRTDPFLVNDLQGRRKRRAVVPILLHLLKVTFPFYFCSGMGIGMGVLVPVPVVGIDPLWLWAGVVVAGVELPALIAPGVLLS